MRQAKFQMVQIAIPEAILLLLLDLSSKQDLCHKSTVQPNWEGSRLFEFFPATTVDTDINYASCGPKTETWRTDEIFQVSSVKVSK